MIQEPTTGLIGLGNSGVGATDGSLVNLKKYINGNKSFMIKALSFRKQHDNSLFTFYKNTKKSSKKVSSFLLIKATCN